MESSARDGRCGESPAGGRDEGFHSFPLGSGMRTGIRSSRRVESPGRRLGICMNGWYVSGGRWRRTPFRLRRPEPIPGSRGTPGGPGEPQGSPETSLRGDHEAGGGGVCLLVPQEEDQLQIHRSAADALPTLSWLRRQWFRGRGVAGSRAAPESAIHGRVEGAGRSADRPALPVQGKVGRRSAKRREARREAFQVEPIPARPAAGHGAAGRISSEMIEGR
jgi:hypothetical protein